MYEWKGDEKRPEFDQDLADTYVGKSILIGITHFDHTGNEISREQMYGVVEAASPDGIGIALRGTRSGESWVMPPVLESISPAKLGEYRLRSTGEVVTDPDLLATWSVTEPIKH
jgi:hypothetical protein